MVFDVPPLIFGLRGALRDATLHINEERPDIVLFLYAFTDTIVCFFSSVQNLPPLCGSISFKTPLPV